MKLEGQLLERNKQVFNLWTDGGKRRGNVAIFKQKIYVQYPKPRRSQRFKFGLSVGGAALPDSNLNGGGIFNINAYSKPKTFLHRMFPWKGWPIIEKGFITVTMLSVIRLLYFIPIKGINIDSLPENMEISTSEQKLLARMFMAGDSVPLNIASLGIGPLIISNIFISVILNTNGLEAIPGPTRDMIVKQKMGILSPHDVERFTFKLALIFGAFMAFSRAMILQPYAIEVNGFVLSTTLVLLAALSITRYCCNIIQDQGYGEGTGFLILSLTLSGFGQTLFSIAKSVISKQVDPVKVIAVFAIYSFMVVLCVCLNKTELRLPLTDYSMKSLQKSFVKEGKYRYIPELDKEKQDIQTLSNSAYLPLGVSQGAVSGLFFCSTIFGFIDPLINTLPAYFSWIRIGLVRSLLFGFLTFLFSLLPMGSGNPNSIAEYLSRVQMGVKGKIPGEETVKYIKLKLFQSRVAGGVILFVIAMVSLWLDIQSQIWIGSSVGSLNLILLVAVIASTARTIESLMEGPKLEAAMKKEKIAMNMS